MDAIRGEQVRRESNRFHDLVLALPGQAENEREIHAVGDAVLAEHARGLLERCAGAAFANALQALVIAAFCTHQKARRVLGDAFHEAFVQEILRARIEEESGPEVAPADELGDRGGAGGMEEKLVVDDVDAPSRGAARVREHHFEPAHEGLDRKSSPASAVWRAAEGAIVGAAARRLSPKHL